MKICVLAAFAVALSGPVFGQTLSQTSSVLLIAPTAQSTQPLTRATRTTSLSRAAASGGLRTSVKPRFSPIVAIAAATNSSSGTK